MFWRTSFCSTQGALAECIHTVAMETALFDVTSSRVTRLTSSSREIVSIYNQNQLMEKHLIDKKSVSKQKEIMFSQQFISVVF